jgi:hypothetical protein
MSRESEHTCHRPGCETKVPPAMFACKPDWFALPKSIRDRIWGEYVPGQEDRMDPTLAYLDVATEAIRWWQQHPKPEARKIRMRIRS